MPCRRAGYILHQARNWSRVCLQQRWCVCARKELKAVCAGRLGAVAEVYAAGNMEIFDFVLLVPVLENGSLCSGGLTIVILLSGLVVPACHAKPPRMGPAQCYISRHL